MTEPRSGGDRPEIGELLSGLDPPRSLPESLRRRLEDGLTASVGAGAGASASADPDLGAPARPLEPELNERLTAALESREDQDMVMLFSGLDAPRPLPPGTSESLLAQLVGDSAPRPGWVAVLVRGGARARIGAGVAAACLLVAAVTGIALTRHNSSRPAATNSTATRAPAIHSGGGASTGGAEAGSSTGAGTGSSGQVAPLVLNGSAGATGAASQGSGGGVSSSSGSGTSPPAAYAASPTASSTSAPSLVPQVAAVNPAGGSVTGGTTVTIRGLNFEGATSVHFGTTAALKFVVTANGQITAISPPHLPGFVNITVTTARGTSAVTKNDRYDYIP